VTLLGLWSAVALGAAFWPTALLPVGLASGALLVAVLGIDLLRARRLPPLRVSRRVSGTLPLRNWSRVAVRLECPDGVGADVELFDHHPTSGEVEGLPRRVIVRPGQWSEVGYRFRPLQRGPFSFGRTELLLRSPWRLWRVRRREGEATPIKVYPDFRTVQHFAILAVDNAVSQLGVRKRQRRGEGLELHQLREYRQGDALRQIDWKATSRRLRIISREYEDERNQQVVFLLDCGRNMRAVDRGAAHFDYALNSVLLLTYVALRQGDAVGLMTLGGPERWLPPQKGPAAMGTVLHAVYDLETQTRAADYVTAATRLMMRQRRRALVVLISNTRDEDADEIASAVRLMRRRHLVLLASLRETALDDVLEEPLRDFSDALRIAAVHHYLAARREAGRALEGRGVSALDVIPENLPISIVNRYLDIKRTGLL
jgi:uncharacterized protein (DUF58 family)